MPTADHVYNQEAVLAYDLDAPSGDPLDDCPLYSSQEAQYEARMGSCLGMLKHSRRSQEEVCKMYMVDPVDVDYYRPVLAARHAVMKARIEQEKLVYEAKYGKK